ncbi:MAG TPA: CidA/LrgA family protein [Comamonadaceae bacterium]|nr:CidA/LrgA family protein [Comamonadaceae bacterium]
MQVLQGLAILLTLQSVGEALSRLLHLPYPGPVIGMVLLLGALRWPAVQQRVQTVARFLLGHLSLLFVPVGVGVVTQLGLLAEHGMRLLLVIVISTWIGLAVAALALRRLMRHTPPPGDHE